MKSQMEKSKLPERLKFIRNHYGWSAREFAKKIGVGHNTLQSYEGGRYYPRAKTLTKMEEVTGFSVNYIQGLEDYFGDHAPLKDMRFESYTEIKIINRLKKSTSLDELLNQSNVERIIKISMGNQKEKQVFGFILKDSSMDSGKDPIREGTILVMEYETPAIKIGDLVLIKLPNQEALCRRVINETNSEITLAANEPTFGNITAKIQDIEAIFKVVRTEYRREYN